MKISEMNGEQLADALCRMAEPVARICEDEKILRQMQEIGRMAGDTTVLELAGRISGALIPALLKDHRADTFEILAALEGRTAKQIAQEKAMEIMRTVREAIYDEELLLFFRSCGEAERKVSLK